MSSLSKIHRHIEEIEGEAKAKRWLLATLDRQDDAIRRLRKEVSALKSRVTRIKNAQRIHPGPIPRD